MQPRFQADTCYNARLIRERRNGAGQVMTKGGIGATAGPGNEGESSRASAEWMDTRGRGSECG